MPQESESVEEGDTGSQEEQGERTQCETSTTVKYTCIPSGCRGCELCTHCPHEKKYPLCYNYNILTFLFVVCRS